MPTRKPFPSTEAALDIYFQAAVPYLINASGRLLASPEKQTELSDALSEWNAFYPATQNRNIRTATIVKNKNIVRDAFIKLLRSVYADIPANVFTVEDRIALNLPKRSTSRTPTPLPGTRPVASVDTNNRLQHTILFTDQDGSLAKPERVRGCQIWHTIGEDATDLSELRYLATVTASPYIYRFPVGNGGKKVYYWLRWENTIGQVGPWSNTVEATISG